MKMLLPPLAFCMLLGLSAHAEPPAADEASPPTPCIATGSSNVFTEGRPMLRLSDVSACDPRTYEIIPSVFVNGEPAVRLLGGGEDGPAPSGATSVTIEGAPASRLGDER